MIIEMITRNRRRIFYEKIDGKLKRIAYGFIQNRIAAGEPVVIKRDLAGRARLRQAQ